MSQAQKDAKKLASAGLKQKTQKLLEIIQNDPFHYPPSYEYLQGDMQGIISRRINRQHRLVYEVFKNRDEIKVYRMWSHYGE